MSTRLVSAVRPLSAILRRPACTCRPFSASSSRPRIADDFVNIIQTDAARPMAQIESLSPKTGITLSDGLVLPAPTIFINGVTFLWDVAPPPLSAEDATKWDGWSLDKLKLFEIVSPRPDMLLVGTGERGLFLPPQVRKYLNGLGIQVDVLDSKNACSTYNLLTEEGRRVAAAIYPLAPFDARTGTLWARS